jgi:hypothetical protein
MDWVSIADDGCRWIVREGHEPFAVLPCNECMVPVDIFEDAVRCPICGKCTPPVIGGDFYDVLKMWNDMVDRVR